MAPNNDQILAERVAVLEKQIALLLSEKAVDVSDAKAPKKPKKTKDDDDKPKKKHTSGSWTYHVLPWARKIVHSSALT